jgi:hypothetical protein
VLNGGRRHDFSRLDCKGLEFKAVAHTPKAIAYRPMADRDILAHSSAILQHTQHGAPLEQIVKGQN